MTQVGAPAVGEVLADRYRLERHVNDDSTGRQVWRGVDVILQRPVTIVLRVPGGAEAQEMLAAAVAASRVTNPHIVGVYDAIDEGTRAYVVREWVEGRSLREAVRDAPLDAGRAAAVAHAIADALAAVHETGVAHGNVHPGTVLMSEDDRVMLADARANQRATQQADIRAVGGVLYCALTGHWPHEIPGPAGLPDAVRVDGHRVCTPQQVRGGIPAYLDELTMALLDPASTPPTAAELAVDLARYHVVDDGGGPLGLGLMGGEAPEEPRPVWKKIMVGVAGLLTIAVAGLLVGTRWLPSAQPTSQYPTASQSPGAGGAQTTPAGDEKIKPLKLTGDNVRIVDPEGDRQELDDAPHMVDGKADTEWRTNTYRGSPEFGRLKPGIGVLITLDQPHDIASVLVRFSTPGATVELRRGDRDPGDSTAGDRQLVKTYTRVGDQQVNAEKEANFTTPDLKTKYLLIWITKLPAKEDGEGYRIGVEEITVYAA